MTVYELFLAFDDIVDKNSTRASPNLSMQDRERMLNYGIEKFIKQRYSGINIHRTSFEETQKRTDDLSNLVVHQEIFPSSDSPIIPNSVFFELPSDYWFSILEMAEVSFIDCDQNRTDIIGIDARHHNHIVRLLSDPFNRPEKQNVFRVIKGRNIQVFYGPQTVVNSVKLGYIASFTKLRLGDTYSVNSGDPNYYITTEFWMNPHTHLEIANIAALGYLEQVGDPRYQSLLNEVTTQE